MFLIFKIFPHWIWLALAAAGVICFLTSYLPPLRTYEVILKISGGVVVAVAIFMQGMLYSDRTWQAAARELEAQVAALSAQSEAVNTVIRDRVVTKLEIVKVRGEEVVRYVDREVAKHDGACVIPPEFTQAHNTAAEVPK